MDNNIRLMAKLHVAPIILKLVTLFELGLGPYFEVGPKCRLKLFHLKYIYLLYGLFTYHNKSLHLESFV